MGPYQFILIRLIISSYYYYGIVGCIYQGCRRRIKILQFSCFWFTQFHQKRRKVVYCTVIWMIKLHLYVDIIISQDSASLSPSDWSDRAPCNRSVRNISCFLSWSVWLELISVSSGTRPDSKYPPQPATAPAPLSLLPVSAAAGLLWPPAGAAACILGRAAAAELAAGLLVSLSSVCLCCCLCSCNSICNCCNCDDDDPATRLTPPNCDNNSAMGSTASLADGDNVDSALSPDPGDGPVLELAGLLWRRVRWELRPPRPWAIRLKLFKLLISC